MGTFTKGGNYLFEPGCLSVPKPSSWCHLRTSGTWNGTYASWAALNPCPLNSCCDTFGQCGTTPEFCTVSKSATGAPGTSAPGQVGCLSKCGVDIVNNAEPPAEFFNIGYYEFLELAAELSDPER